MPAGTSEYIVRRCRKCFVSVDNGFPMGKGPSCRLKDLVHCTNFLTHAALLAKAVSP